MVRQVAAEHPTTVQLEDFGAQLCPGGHFTTSFDGVQIRDGDGVHVVPTLRPASGSIARVLPDVVGGRPSADGRARLGVHLGHDDDGHRRRRRVGHRAAPELLPMVRSGS